MFFHRKLGDASLECIVLWRTSQLPPCLLTRGALYSDVLSPFLSLFLAFFPSHFSSYFVSTQLYLEEHGRQRSVSFYFLYYFHKTKMPILFMPLANCKIREIKHSLNIIYSSYLLQKNCFDNC